VRINIVIKLFCKNIILITLFVYLALVAFDISAVQDFGDMMRPAEQGGLMPSSGSGVNASSMPAVPDFSLNPFETIKQQTGADANADSFEIIGDNLIAKGNIKLRKGNLLLYSDMVVVNNTTKNIELSGNVKFYNIVNTRLEVEYWELKTLERDPDVEMKVVGTIMTTTGRQKIVVDLMRQVMAWTGNKAIGNLDTGIFEFGKFATNLGGYTAVGTTATRSPDGQITIKDAETSPCMDFSEGHSLFSIKSGKIVAYPSSITDKRARIMQDEYSAKAHFADEGSGSGWGDNDYNIWGYNNLLYVGNIPILWLPVFYKPAMGDIGNWTFSAGQDTAWGYFVNTTNSWNVIDDENTQLSLSNMIDYYSLRGLGLGNQTMLSTEDSRTELFMYGIADGNPNTNYPDFSRFGKMPKWKYRGDLTLTNMTHLADGLDFRGQFAKLSDLYFLYNFFYPIALINPQPASYGNLEYNNEHLNLAFTVRPRTNDFYSVVETLPELSLNMPRQEVWNGIYYQGTSSVGYKSMKWRDFDISRAEAGLGNGVDPADYDSGRFDTLHFGYYPLKLDWLNVIPRAGVRFTAYSRSSKQKVSPDDLDNMLQVQQPESQSNADIVNYDNEGGAQGRFAGEVGVEFNTKISKSWNSVKNAYWELDGLRHTMQPYVNYTYIPEPTVNRDNLYYFDDIDRISETNFARIGLQNRLQTRRGSWKDSETYTWASMETYFDVLASGKNDEYYLQGGYKGENGKVNYDAQRPSEYGGVKQLGDIGHIMTLNASDALSFNFQFLLDGQRLSTGDWLRSINKLSVNGNYELAEGWSVNGGWYVGTDGYSQGPYSMGSSFTRLQSGSVFQRIFTASNSTYGGLNYKINERTLGTVSFNYDFYQELMPGLTFSITRQLPCGLELLLDATVRDQPNTDGVGKHTEFRWGVNIGFSSSPNFIIQPRESLLPESISRLANS
jgi:hypothetical protein